MNIDRQDIKTPRAVQQGVSYLSTVDGTKFLKDGSDFINAAYAPQGKQGTMNVDELRESTVKFLECFALGMGFIHKRYPEIPKIPVFFDLRELSPQVVTLNQLGGEDRDRVKIERKRLQKTNQPGSEDLGRNEKFFLLSVTSMHVHFNTPEDYLTRQALGHGVKLTVDCTPEIAALMIGAHETFHVADSHKRPARIKEEMKTYDSVRSSSRQHLQHPIERRAHAAERAALEFFAIPYEKVSSRALG